MARSSRRVLAAGVALAALTPACFQANQLAISSSGIACPLGSTVDGQFCGENVPPGSGSDLLVGAEGLAFIDVDSGETIKVLSAAEGRVDVTLNNIGTAVHNFRVDAAVAPPASEADSIESYDPDNPESYKKVQALGGEVVTGPLFLFAGEYTFYCDIPGHRAAGMEGVLTVAAAGSVPANPDADTDTDAA